MMKQTSGQLLSIKKTGGNSTKETMKVVLQALILAFAVRTFLFQPFIIPSGSMRPTLLVGDYIFVSKYAYGYSHFSLPFSPNLFSGRILSAKPERGDVAVFRRPDDTSVDYIKRVIGLPGDRIRISDGILYINGIAAERQKTGETKDVDMIGDIPNSERLFNPDADMPVSVYREILPNNVSYNTFDILPMGPGDNTVIFDVPENHYFMLGDNRDNSLDSRFSLGYVPFENFVGKANLVFFSIREKTSPWKIWYWPSHVRWERVLSLVHKVHDVPVGS